MIRAMMLATSIVGALMATGCDGPATISSGVTETTGRDRQPRAVPSARLATTRSNTSWAEKCPIPSDAPQAPVGRTAAALLARYGPAATDERFVLGEALDPVRMTMRNVFPAPADRNRNIREMTWRAHGCMLTIWLAGHAGREVAVRTMRAPTGGES